MPKKVLLAKTGLDGHWRGLSVVARALRDAGLEVVYVGMVLPEEVAMATVDEDVDLVGLNIGGRYEVAVRIIKAVQEAAPGLPIFAGGTIPPPVARRLEEEKGVPCFPPGSSLADITAAAFALIDGEYPPDGP